ncbi:hypothetical protein P8936_04945 [Edaphobacter paludis]|uniref:DUF948 domain-containing protein n=1 Tax=Edaphobacter paludis TaxID=3035702 RepID=A0AAU7D159_9BACT
MIAAQFIMSGMWLQDSGSISSGNSTLLMVFVGLVALALIVQAIALVTIAMGAAKARKRVLVIAEELRAKAIPVLDSTGDFMKSTAPKMIVLAENLVETSNLIRHTATGLNATLNDVNSKARVQAARADEIVTTILMGTAEVVDSVQAGIRVPVREFNGLVSGFKAGLDVLVGRSKSFGNGRNVRSYRDSNDIDL